MVTFNLKYSEIEGLKRLDPEYYNPAYNDIVKRVRSINSVKLNTVLNIELGPAYSSKKILKFGEIPISKIGDVTNKRDFSVWDSLDNNEFIKFGSRRIKQNEILMTLTGDPPDVGKVNMPFTEFDDESTILAFNQRVAKLDTKGIDPFYLFTILSTEYFRIRFEQCAFGIRQRNVSIPDLKTAFVYIAEPQEIENISKLTKEHFRLKRESQTLYQQATALLEQELGLDNFEKDKSKFRITKLSELSGSFRFDSQCFKPEYLQYEEYIRNNNSFDKLTSLLTSVTKGNQQDISDNGKYPYMSIKDISGIDIISKGKVTTPASMAYKDDLLLAVTGATIGKIGIVYRDNTMSFSGDVVSLRVNKEKISPWYLLAILNSQIGQTQFNRWITGSTNGHLSPSDLRKVIVPRLDSTIELLIEEKLKKAIELSISSENLLKEAKTRVEQLIEAAANQ